MQQRRHGNDAEALQNADIVFRVDDQLAPWFKKAIDSLAGGARAVELIETEGTTKLAYREGATFERHRHDDNDHHADDHEADQKSDQDTDDADHHDHHGHDPHAWLDLENARLWLEVIAAELSTLDPDNADGYRNNAVEGKAELKMLIGQIQSRLDSVHDRNFVVFHDAYQYFENRFGLSAVGSIRLGDASDPSPARITEIRDRVAELDIRCVFSEPQFNPDLVQTVFDKTDARIGILDPLGSDLTPGPALYPQLLGRLTDNLVSCLASE